MSSGQSQTRAKRRAPPRPTTAKQSPAGLVISVLLHAGLLAATFWTWNHMVALSPETHAVPVDLVIERQTNVRAEAPPPQPDKPVTQTVQMDEPRSCRHLSTPSPRRCRRFRKSKSSSPRPTWISPTSP